MSFQDLEAGRTFGSRRDCANGNKDSTQAVASGIFQINTVVSTFQLLVNTLGTPKDTPELREKLHKTRLRIGQLVKDTSTKLKQVSEIDHHVLKSDLMAALDKEVKSLDNDNWKFEGPLYPPYIKMRWFFTQADRIKNLEIGSTKVKLLKWRNSSPEQMSTEGLRLCKPLNLFCVV